MVLKISDNLVVAIMWLQCMLAGDDTNPWYEVPYSIHTMYIKY